MDLGLILVLRCSGYGHVDSVMGSCVHVLGAHYTHVYWYRPSAIVINNALVTEGFYLMVDQIQVLLTVL